MTCSSFGPPQHEDEEEQYKTGTVPHPNQHSFSEHKFFRKPSPGHKTTSRSWESAGPNTSGSVSLTFLESSFTSTITPSPNPNKPPPLHRLGPKPSSSSSSSIYHSKQEPYSSTFLQSTLQDHLATRKHSFLFLNLSKIDYIDSGPSIERLEVKATELLKHKKAKGSKTASSTEKPSSLASSSSTAVALVQGSASPSKRPR